MELWTRHDGQVRVLEYLGGPPEPWAVLERPLTRLLAVCEWLDARCPPWEDTVIFGGVLGVLCALLALAL